MDIVIQMPDLASVVQHTGSKQCTKRYNLWAFSVHGRDLSGQVPIFREPPVAHSGARKTHKKQERQAVEPCCCRGGTRKHVLHRIPSTAPCEPRQGPEHNTRKKKRRRKNVVGRTAVSGIQPCTSWHRVKHTLSRRLSFAGSLSPALFPPGGNRARDEDPPSKRETKMTGTTYYRLDQQPPKGEEGNRRTGPPSRYDMYYCYCGHTLLHQRNGKGTLSFALPSPRHTRTHLPGPHRTAVPAQRGVRTGREHTGSNDSVESHTVRM